MLSGVAFALGRLDMVLVAFFFVFSFILGQLIRSIVGVSPCEMTFSSQRAE